MTKDAVLAWVGYGLAGGYIAGVMVGMWMLLRELTKENREW